MKESTNEITYSKTLIIAKFSDTEMIVFWVVSTPELNWTIDIYLWHIVKCHLSHQAIDGQHSLARMHFHLSRAIGQPLVSILGQSTQIGFQNTFSWKYMHNILSLSTKWCVQSKYQLQIIILIKFIFHNNEQCNNIHVHVFIQYKIITIQ